MFTHLKGFSSNDFKRPTRIYDVVKKELIGKFESALAAARFAGVDTSTVFACISRKTRMNKKNTLNKTITFR